MKKRMIITLLLLVLCFALPAAVLAQDADSGQTADSTLSGDMEGDTVIAVVNGEDITANQLNQKADLRSKLQRINRIDSQLAQILTNSDAGKLVLRKYQRAKLDALIDNVLLEQQVEADNISLTQAEKDEIYQQQKQAIMQKNDMTEAEFKSVLEKQGFNDEQDYKDQFTSNPQLKVNKLIKEKVISDITVTESELQQEYDRNKDAFQQSKKEITFAKVKPQLEKMIKQQKQNQAIQQYLVKLRKEADIEIKI